MKTLVVEDDFSSRVLLHTYLSRFGECHVAVNGSESIRAFRVASEASCPYDLICLDIMMPEVDGLTALQAMRQLEAASGILPGNGVKMIMTTALRSSRDIVAAFNGLCDAYVTKPVELSKLLQHLREWKLIPEAPPPVPA